MPRRIQSLQTGQLAQIRSTRSEEDGRVLARMVRVLAQSCLCAQRKFSFARFIFLMWYDADSASWISCLYSRQGMPYSPEATPRQITIHDCARPSQLLRASYCRRRILVLPHRRYRDETARTRVVHLCCRNALKGSCSRRQGATTRFL